MTDIPITLPQRPKTWREEYTFVMQFGTGQQLYRTVAIVQVVRIAVNKVMSFNLN